MKPFRRKSEIDAQLAEVRAVYADLAKRPIERSCINRTECCYFKRTGLTPMLTDGEARLAAKAWRATGRKELKQRADGGCPMLVGEEGQGKCAIYADRPFGCRTHFCDEAGGPYSRKEVIDLIHRLELIDSKLGGPGPTSLGAAVARALDGP